VSKLGDEQWRKASACHQGSCVEVADSENSIAFRDSKDLDGPILRYPREVFQSFLDYAKEGKLDKDNIKALPLV
jgi:hypothetical protein